MMNMQNLKSFGITYVGVRTKHIDEMKRFAEEVLGYHKTHDEGDFVAFNTPQGQRFELFAEDTPDKQHYPLDGAVPGFEVPDFDVALAWLKANNYELVKDGMGEGKSGARWVHFIGPDGNAYEFVYHPAIATSGKLE
jgi:catechol 2,3-dioxygenase-like lactoylglutathione lyase family enzyme